jgi:hypothetical protein
VLLVAAIMLIYGFGTQFNSIQTNYYICKRFYIIWLGVLVSTGLRSVRGNVIASRIVAKKTIF